MIKNGEVFFFRARKNNHQTLERQEESFERRNFSFFDVNEKKGRGGCWGNYD
jgi:hypothetical protein